MPKISFITPCYNGEKFLDGLFKDQLCQSFDDWEHIVVDSASTDNSCKIIEKWTLKDSRIKLIKQETRTSNGLGWCHGWQHANGELVINANVDDRWIGPWATYQINMYSSNSDQNIALWYGGYRTIKNDVIIAEGIPKDFTLEDWQQFYRGGPRLCWRNSLKMEIDFKAFAKVATQYKSAFDYYLCLSILSMGYSFYRIPKVISIYDLREDSIENINKELSNFESLRAIETFFPSSVAIQNLENITRYQNPDFYKRYQNFKTQFSL